MHTHLGALGRIGGACALMGSDALRHIAAADSRNSAFEDPTDLGGAGRMGVTRPCGSGTAC